MSVRIPKRWHPATTVPNPGGEIHLWWLADIAGGHGSLAEDLTLLSDTERARAERSIRPSARARFITARAFLRRVLARYRDEAPGSLRLHGNEHGKPMLPGGPSFNLSHSRCTCIVAVGGDIELGVDLESAARSIQIPPHLVLGPDERHALPPPGTAGHDAALLRAWVRKEAVLKARGTGFAGDAHRVQIEGTDAPRFTAAQPGGLGFCGVDLDLPDPGWIGAVAWTAPQAPSAIRGFVWPTS